MLRLFTGLTIGFSVITGSMAAKTEIAGEMGIETRVFIHQPTDNRQGNNNTSLYLQPEFYKELSKSWSLTFTPFMRLDQTDNKRSHNDIRELVLHKTAKTWELKLGASKVFWGVTESQHLVDIINQTDAIEATDGEEKLGQPMINLILKRKWGTTSLFMLPYFRQRSFPGLKGRLRSIPLVDTNQTLYESSKKEKNIDYAARWSKIFGDWDMGLSHFSGTSRIPDFIFGTSANGEPAIIPFYAQIDQTGIDIQATKGSWLWKFEMIHRRNKTNSTIPGVQTSPYTAVTAGFEYTKTGVFKSKADLGILVEYLYDDRNDSTKTPFEDDVMLATRITLNDTASTQLLSGVILDADSSERSFFIEFSRRIGQSYKLSIEARTTSNITPTSLLYSFRNDDLIQVQFTKYF